MEHITTGFNEHDYHTVTANFDKGQKHSGSCYCDSSHDQSGCTVIIVMSVDGYDIKYYRDDQNHYSDQPDDACLNKS